MEKKGVTIYRSVQWAATDFSPHPFQSRLSASHSTEVVIEIKKGCWLQEEG